VTVCEVCGKPFERAFGGGNLTEGGTAFKCPECAAKSLASQPRQTIDGVQPSAGIAGQSIRIRLPQPWVTYGLIAVCFAVFVLELVKGAGFDSMSAPLAVQLGANFGPLTITGQWWRLLTSMFLHFGIIHIASNMYCLLILGSLAERLMGRAGYLVLYFGAGLAGSLLSLAVHPQIVSAGASGGVFGVAGGLVTYLWLKKAPLDFASVKSQLQRLGIFIGINVIYSLQGGIDMMAHAGGLIAGLAIGATLPPFLLGAHAATIPIPGFERSSNSKRVATVGIGCVIAILAGIVAVKHFQGDTVYVWNSLDQIDAGHSSDVVPTLEQIVKRQPDSGIAHFALGAAYLRTNRAEDAVRELERAVQIDPTDADFRKQLNEAYLTTGQVGKIIGN
jgi:membrane associated rhomboid family serine protease